MLSDTRNIRFSCLEDVLIYIFFFVLLGCALCRWALAWVRVLLSFENSYCLFESLVLVYIIWIHFIIGTFLCVIFDIRFCFVSLPEKNPARFRQQLIKQYFNRLFLFSDKTVFFRDNVILIFFLFTMVMKLLLWLSIYQSTAGKA